MGIDMTQLIPWQDDPAYLEEIKRIQRVTQAPTRDFLENTTNVYYAMLHNPEANVFEVYEIVHGKER